MDKAISRRNLLLGASGPAAGLVGRDLAGDTLPFVRRCAREDGGYAPSPDPAYSGYSDTSLSDLAAVTYAATLAKTMGWRLPRRERSIDFIQGHQQADGSYRSRGGKWDP